MSLEDKFKEATESVKTMTFSKTVPTDRKLILYSLFKQANDGDVTGTQPSMIFWEQRSKWDAWATQKGKDRETCMQEYIDELEKQKAEFM
mmetsp:Transcript_52435/g.103502  ORF Transcript_52435/g.103502 Transcript_52435/m.103502 type:complete len:90 (-) Transcript_52435:82-351(-)